MVEEILDAVEQFYGGDDEAYVDALLYLSQIKKQDLFYFQNRASRRLLNMHRCPYCGAEYVYHSYKELHDELDGCPTEEFAIECCPNGCDV